MKEERETMGQGKVTVRIIHDDVVVMEKVTSENVIRDNVPKIARALMYQLYIRLDDQIDAAKLRAHRRRLRANRREQAVGQILTTEKVVDSCGRSALRYESQIRENARSYISHSARNGTASAQ